MQYAKKIGKNIVLLNGFTDFNEAKVINSKKKLLFKKSYIYNNSEVFKGAKETSNDIEILEIHDNSLQVRDTVLVIYFDPRGRLSFIIIKNKHPKLTYEEVIEKAESTPPQRFITFSLFNHLYIFGVLRFRYANMKSVQIALGYDKSLTYNFRYVFSHKIRKKFSENTNKLALLLHTGFVKIKKDDLLEKYIDSSEINLPAYIKTINKDNLNYFYPLKYKSSDVYNKENYIFSTGSHKLNKYLEFFIRKSITGQLVIVITDHLSKFIKLKEKVALFLSRFGNQEKYDIYFEKFAKNAGESAFELFKKSKEENDSNSKFILDKENVDFYDLQSIYGEKNVVAHNSLRSFYYVFKAKRFISSDLVSHLQRRLYDNSRVFKKKILNNNKKIFLQHGPSLATNVFQRGYFNKKVPICPDYIVTNSKIESEYFKKYPKFTENEIIELGIPNLDLYANTRNDSKEEITFMLTWRPWDITGKIEPDSYIDRYIQFLNVIRNDDFYDEKVINITLHPKAKLTIENQFPDVYEKLRKYIYEGDIKDALINSKVVITDYSSICFYAFGGGSNIIYFWGDKEIAEQEYGAPNILQSHNRFGDIVYNITDEIDQVIKENYIIEQRQKYKENYKKLIEYSDGNNTTNVYDAIRRL